MKHEPLYIISGWGFSADILSHGALAGQRCVKLDYTHYSDLSLEEVALELAKAVQKPATLVAWSLGGMLAIKIASLFPQKIKNLILLASQPKLLADISCSGIDPVTFNVFTEKMHQDFYRSKEKFIAEVNFPNKKFLYKNILKNYFLENHSEQLKGFLKMFSADLRVDYRCLKTNILHIMGGKDAILKHNEQHLREMNNRITVAYVEDAGHCGFLTHAKLYRSIIDGFVS